MSAKGGGHTCSITAVRHQEWPCPAPFMGRERRGSRHRGVMWGCLWLWLQCPRTPAIARGSWPVKKGRHRRFEEARALKRTNDDFDALFGPEDAEPCVEC